jgi:site-specific DNA recombinase
MVIDIAPKVAVYCRVSTAEQVEHGTSIEHQTEQLRNFCQSQTWNIVGEYIDAGYSAKDGNRPELERECSTRYSYLSWIGFIVI